MNIRPVSATRPTSDNNVIDKASFMAAADTNNNNKMDEDMNSRTTLWAPTNIRTVPAFYPLEKSSRLIEDDTAADVAARISECLRRLSIQALYENSTAHLLSAEHVEMHLSLWRTPAESPQQGIVVELQRRNGDSLAYHRYSRSILDAAMGLVDLSELGTGADGSPEYMYSKKVQRLLSNVTPEQDEHEIAIQAIEIAHGLLMKDRMDARVLGLESLCLLTDPTKAGVITSILTAHVVILGSISSVDIAGVPKEDFPDEGPFQEIQQSILNLVQFSRIEDEDDDIDQDATNETDEGHMKLLHNLALAVLANALDCIENPDRFELEDTKPRGRLRTASSTEVANEFLQSPSILATLIQELGKAAQKPHNAVLSAKCIGSLCRASKDARKRAKELGAKQVVSTALDVGVKTHLKLETEVKKVQTVLEQREEDE
jgi:hypothetical protein